MEQPLTNELLVSMGGLVVKSWYTVNLFVWRFPLMGSGPWPQDHLSAFYVVQIPPTQGGGYNMGIGTAPTPDSKQVLIRTVADFHQAMFKLGFAAGDRHRLGRMRDALGLHE